MGIPSERARLPYVWQKTTVSKVRIHSLILVGLTWNILFKDLVLGDRGPTKFSDLCHYITNQHQIQHSHGELYLPCTQEDVGQASVYLKRLQWCVQGL